MIVYWRATTLGLTSGAVAATSLELGGTEWRSIVIAFVIAAAMGALMQIEQAAVGKQPLDKTLAFCACVFSGVAGFATYAYFRSVVDDALVLLLYVVFAGVCGAPLVKQGAAWFRKLFPGEANRE